MEYKKRIYNVDDRDKLKYRYIYIKYKKKLIWIHRIISVYTFPQLREVFVNELLVLGHELSHSLRCDTCMSILLSTVSIA